jgi:hypothetical protein
MRAFGVVIVLVVACCCACVVQCLERIVISGSNPDDVRKYFCAERELMIQIHS